MKNFDGTPDPNDHVNSYEAVARMEHWTDHEIKEGFYRMLMGTAADWHTMHIAEIGSMPQVTVNSYLMNLRQGV